VKAPLLSLQGLEKRFGAVTALRGLDIEIERGGALAVLGPNGAGKSTLLRVMAGLVHPTAGHVRFAGHASPRTAVGYLGHATLLYPELSARENLIFAARLQQTQNPAERADVLLAEERLQDVAHRPAGSFSRGMAQRLSLARARVSNPELLLLDEPYTGLDRRSSAALTRRLRSLRDDGHALVLVTHDVREAAALADAAVILVAGRIARRCQGDELAAERLDSIYAETLEALEGAEHSGTTGLAKATSQDRVG
jgi:heme ABC exporter ATP-binding subunit CcmA